MENDEAFEYNEQVLPELVLDIVNNTTDPKEQAQELIDYAEENLPKIGSGDEKHVYELDRGVLVVPHRDIGFEKLALRVDYEQNNQFGTVLPKVLGGSDQGSWLVMENLTMDLSSIENKYQELFGMGSNDVLDVVEAEFGESNLPDEVIERKRSKINDLNYFEEYISMMGDVRDKVDGYFVISEFIAPRNNGIDGNGNLVNADFGII
jgi:hypothetical protein